MSKSNTPLELTLERHEFIIIENGISALSFVKDFALQDVLCHNAEVIESELKPFHKAAKTVRKPTEGYAKYLKELDVLRSKYQLIKNGEPQKTYDRTTNQFVEVMDPEKAREFSVQLDNLQKKFKDALDKRKKIEEDYEAKLEEEITVKGLIKVDPNLLPDDLEGGILKSIYKIVDHDIEKKPKSKEDSVEEKE